MQKYFLSAIAVAALTFPAAAQVQNLSDFEAGTVDGWSGATVNNTPFASGSTAVSNVDDAGNKVLNIADSGFGGGASKNYTGVGATNGVITIVGDLKIVTDPGNLSVDTAFGIKVGTGVGTQQDFAYSKAIGTAATDSGQAFQKVAAAVHVGAATTADITAAVTPDKVDWSVASGAWVMQLDNVKRVTEGTETLLSSFNGPATDGWVANSATNSPFAAGTTGVGSANESGNGVLTITDAGFAAGAARNYVNAATGAGIHTVLADVRIVTDPGTLVQARMAVAPGFSTNAANLSWSKSFSTAADDSGQAFTTVAAPLVTTGSSDVAVYIFPDFDASVATGSWEIRVDNVRIRTGQQVPVDVSLFAIE